MTQVQARFPAAEPVGEDRSARGLRISSWPRSRLLSLFSPSLQGRHIWYVEQSLRRWGRANDHHSSRSPFLAAYRTHSTFGLVLLLPTRPTPRRPYPLLTKKDGTSPATLSSPAVPRVTRAPTLTRSLSLPTTSLRMDRLPAHHMGRVVGFRALSRARTECGYVGRMQWTFLQGQPQVGGVWVSSKQMEI